MTKEEVITKVQKLFALSKSSNEHEAALAATKARGLLSSYNLTFADVTPAEIEKQLDVSQVYIELDKSRIPSWNKQLFSMTAHHFECRPVLWNRVKGKVNLLFIGEQTDITVAVYTYDYLFKQLDTLVKNKLPELKQSYPGVHGTVLRNDYLEGAISMIYNKLKEDRETITKREEACSSLMVLKKDKIDEFIGEHIGPLGNSGPLSRSPKTTAWQRGYADAKGINIHKGIEGNNVRSTLE